MRTFLLATSLLAAAALAGCKSAPPPAPVAQALATPKATRFDSMTDEQLVHANQADGLGLGLKVAGLDGNRFPAGAPVPLHIAMEDLGAREPIASGMCSGFTLMATDLNTQESQTNEITPNNCIAVVPYPDEIPFTKGKLKIVELSQRNASNMTLAPGTYGITVAWHAVRAGKPTMPPQPPYTTVTSNTVQITVTP